ncbi:MAG TPA: PASTA domain-containing protein [Elusimicrobiota bacterium]|nr:PASTA domain-containing protein [Elusimicrobiota bacterium]
MSAKRLIPAIFLGVALAVVYFSFDWAVGAAIHNRKVVMVPDVTGKSVMDALNLLGPLQLGVSKEGEQFDKRYPAGTVVHQNPPPGMMVREGRIIKITISQGGETLFVPDLVAQPIRNAQTMLQNVGLSLGEMDRRPSLRYEKDQVMSTDPAAGAVISKNGIVNLIVSDGPPGADVQLAPDFTGKTLSDAKTWAAAHQVNVTVREESDIGKAAGEILMQSPTADSPLHPGDPLVVVINTGAASADGPHIRFDVPPEGNSDRDIKIIIVDEAGEHEVFRHAQAPGSRIDIPVTAHGRARARIFVNGIMMEEQELQ